MTLGDHPHNGELSRRGRGGDAGGPEWLLSSSSDRAALDIVDGAGRFDGHGPHYSRRTPGSKTFTGVGREVVLVHRSGAAVWACVYQRTPSARGTGGSRGRTGEADPRARFIWRNMLFRNLGAGLSSALITSATAETYRQWRVRYGELPPERLRTEIGIAHVRSTNPGFCYLAAGWERDRIVRGKLYLYAPLRQGQEAQAGMKPKHEARESRGGRFSKSQPCDACNKPVGTEYMSDPEVCDSSDGPGFFLCERGGRDLNPDRGRARG